MSKHKHFHNIKTPTQMFQHSRREKIGPLDPGRARPKKKTALNTTTDTEDGQEAQQGD